METEAKSEGGVRKAEGATPLPLVREFDRGLDYPLVSAWWQGHGWPPVSASILPALGVVSYFTEADGFARDAAAGWLYMDNSGSGVCMLEWLVTDPALGGRRALRSLGAVVDFLQQRAAALGYAVMLTTCRQPGLARLLERHAFTKTDEGMIHLAHIIRR